LRYVLPFEGSSELLSEEAGRLRTQALDECATPSIPASDATILPFRRSEKTGAQPPEDPNVMGDVLSSVALS
jgi:hypothetical protein